MRDPFLQHVVQPVVDATSLDPKAASLQAATGFLVSALIVSFLRVLAYGPDAHFGQALHVIGAIMLFPWMRWCVANSAVARIGAPGAMHAVLRWMLLLCTALDVVELVRVLEESQAFLPGAVTRASMAAIEDGLGAAALFLSACDAPPPMRRRHPVPA